MAPASTRRAPRPADLALIALAIPLHGSLTAQGPDGHAFKKRGRHFEPLIL